MSSVGDWLTLHGFDIVQLRDMIAAVWTRGIEGPFSHCVGFPEGAISPGELPDISTREAACSTIIAPAFSKVFPDVPQLRSMLERVRFETLRSGEGQRPHTIDKGKGEAPVVVMEWCSGSAESLMQLAHEMAHALQIMLSEHHFMPPVAREVCAFLGELVVMDHVRTRAGELFGDLLQIWGRDNGSYLGSDLELLRQALEDVSGAYDYRFNYPPARLMALDLFRRRADGDMLRSLFSSGEEAMGLLDLAEGVAASVCKDNPLHPMPEWNAAVPAMNAYRGLGAVVVLDLVSGASTAAYSIGKYYGIFSEWLKEEHLHLVLDEERRPVGYAVQENMPCEAEVPQFILERAIYCSREDLREKVQRRLKECRADGVSERQKREGANECANREVRIDPYAAVGYALELLVLSDYHKDFSVRDYLNVEILPPVLRGQAHFHLAKEGVPLAMVTWAWLSPEVEREVLETGRALRENEWKCGDRLFFNDWIAPFGHSREVMRHLRKNVFPGISMASGVRRNQDGSIRRIGRGIRSVKRSLQQLGSC